MRGVEARVEHADEHAGASVALRECKSGVEGIDARLASGDVHGGSHAVTEGELADAVALREVLYAVDGHAYDGEAGGDIFHRVAASLERIDDGSIRGLYEYIDKSLRRAACRHGDEAVGCLRCQGARLVHVEELLTACVYLVVCRRAAGTHKKSCAKKVDYFHNSILTVFIPKIRFRARDIAL